MRRDPEKKEDSKKVKSFLIIVGILFMILVLRLFYLQIIKGEEYKKEATLNSLKQSVVPTLRGKIYDKNGEMLATNTTGYQLIHLNTMSLSKEEYTFLKDNIELDEFKFLNKLKLEGIEGKKYEKLLSFYNDITTMAKITDISILDILKKIYNTKPEGIDKIVIIDEDLDKNRAFVNIENINNDNIDIVEYDKRYYPNKELASHVIGNVKIISEDEYDVLKDEGYGKDDLIGKKGIEKEYDKLMRGKFGKEYVEVDARGNVISRIKEVEAEKGDNIYLTIDLRLQKYMTELYTGKYGVFIAMEAKTGKILTLVSSPEIDLNLLSGKISQKTWDNLVNSPDTPLVNKAISGLFPPGSTFKVVSGSAILEGGIKDNEVINSNGSYTYSGVTFRDSHRSGHGLTNFYKSIEESVNTYYYHFIRKIDRNMFFDIAKDYGIGEKTGIDLPNEMSGVLPTPEWKSKRFKNTRDGYWLPGDLINMSIGQGYLLVTPIQILQVYQAIANDGVMIKPQLLDRIDDGSKITKVEPTVKRKLNISDETIQKIKKALKLPVHGAHGTARILNLNFVDVSAKTGTAQNSHGADHSWIAGYFPSDSPEIVFVALIETGGYGGVAAGAKVKDFITKYYEIKNENIK